jgi:2,3-dihydroxybenzoate-AMP ligase
VIPVRQVWPNAFATRYREAGYWSGETFPGFLRERAERMPDRIAVTDGGHACWTYAELWRRSETAAAGFLSLGLRPGDRVLVQLANLPEFVSAAFGLFRAGLIPVFTLPAHRIAELTHFARKSEAAALIVGPSPDGFDYRSLARAVQAEVPAVRHVIAVGEAGDCVAFDGFRADSARLPHIDPASSDVVLMQISGGSTGLSKLIPRTHDDYLYSCRASAEICGLGRNSVYLGVLPVAHNFPMSSPGIFGTLYAGGRVVMSPSPSPEVAFGLIERERVTITALVPPLALVWLKAAPNTKADLASLEVLQVGGAKFMPEAARRVRPTFGCTLQQVFGMAEGLVNYTRLDDPEEIIVETQGRPISPDDEVLILDDQGAPVAEGEPGNLLTRGPYTIRAYHNDDGANARAFTDDGYYRTGDVVRRTPEGYLIVQGRATDHINRAGEKISAEEVEDHLLAHPNVFDAAIVAVPDPYLGERSCAFVIPSGEKPKSAALKAWIRERGLAEFKVPDQIVFVESFRTTAVGKISRKELRAELRERLLDGR